MAPSDTAANAYEGMQYSQMAGKIRPELLSAIEAMGYKTMSPVQQKVLSMPDLTRDCLVQAKTGTGKTTAFLVPVLQKLLNDRASLPRGHVGALVIAPTRELASQIAEECDKLTSKCQPRVECHLAYGGSNKNSMLNKFKAGNPSILVATPGRLYDILEDEEVRQKFAHMQALVLDEADTMLDTGFLPAIQKILKALPNKQAAGWQGYCFSATVPPKVKDVVHNVLKPGYVHISTVDANDTPTVDSIPQSLYTVDGVEGILPALHLLLTCELHDNPSLKAIVFTHTARYTGLIHEILSVPGVLPAGTTVLEMQSRMSQSARERTVNKYKTAKSGILIASDVVGRGMDFTDVGLVVQIGVPQNSDQYVHRVGRTGRAGKSGRAVSILMSEEMDFVRKNPQFPLKQSQFSHPLASSIDSPALLKKGLAKVEPKSIEQAYQAFLGYLNNNRSIHKLPPDQMVVMANRFATSVGCDQPPEISARTVGKMNLKGVPGLRIKKDEPRQPRQTREERYAHVNV